MKLRAKHVERAWTILNAALWIAVGMALAPSAQSADLDLFRWVPSDEKPRMVVVKYAPDKARLVEVYDRTCLNGHQGAWAVLENELRPIIYLCGQAHSEAHEIDHMRGMKHGPWERVGRVACARVLEPGYETRYQAGDHICVTLDTRYEWIESRKTTE